MAASPDPKTIRSLVRIARGEDGRIDPERVAAVLQALAKNPPRDHRGVLRAFHRAVAREVARAEAVVEHAGELAPEALQQIGAALEQRYGRKLALRQRPAPELLAGFRARVGDDLWDVSAVGKLARLSSALAS